MLKLKRAMNNIFTLQYKCQIPANLSMEALLRKYPIQVNEHIKNPNKVRDRLLFILDQFVRSSYGNIFTKSHKVGDYTFSMCSEIMQLYTRDYATICQYLLNNGIVIKIHDPQVGSKCTQYKFAPKYVGQKIVNFTILDPNFVETIYAVAKKKAIKKYPELFKFLVELKVDWECVEAIREHYYDDVNYKDWERQLDILWAIEDPRMAKYTIGKTNRLYSTISNLKSDFRAALRYNGKPLIGIDLKNSIPFLSIALFDYELLTKEGLLAEIMKFNPQLKNLGKETTNNETDTPPFGVNGGDVNLSSIMLVDIARQPEIYSDVKQYKELVIKGEIYKFLGEECDFWFDAHYEKKEAKKRVLIAQNGYCDEASRSTIVYEQLFPTVHKAFRQLQTGFDFWSTRKRHKAKANQQISTFAYVTQRFEAKIILDMVCGEIVKTRPEIPLFTIHDCIYTTEDYIPHVQEVLENKVFELIKYKPLIEIDKTWEVDYPIPINFKK